MGSWKIALILTGLYLICTFMRQFLEVHLMSGQMGLSPFETLGAVYVGLKLFGIAGLFLGPLGLLLIEDMTELLIILSFFIGLQLAFFSLIPRAITT